jgi:hypothetical protein
VRGCIPLKVSVIEICWSGYKNFETDVLYYIASSRAQGFEAIVFHLKTDSDEAPFRSASVRLCKKLKRKGIIQMFLFGENIVSQTTESAYLLNKYPKLPDVISGLGTNVTLKL